MNFKKKWLDLKIEKRLGGYRQQINYVAEALPLKPEKQLRVAVIGGGLAGVTAAVLLCERGFEVEVFEKNSYLGGKVGAWKAKFEDGFESTVEHGFHAFFNQYYNLHALLEKFNLHKNLIPIEDYLIITKKYGRFSFKNIKRTPIKNLLSLSGEKIFSLADILRNPAFIRMFDLLKYHPVKTFEKFDTVSFEEFVRGIGLPDKLEMMFTTFSRAFFAEPQYMSMAELIKSFHFYFLSNDGGLLYQVLNDDFSQTLWQPLKNFIEANGGQIHLGNEIVKIEKKDNFFLINGKVFDYAIIASDVVGTKKIITSSGYISKNYPEFYRQIMELKKSQRYAVLRIWIDKDLSKKLPFFIFTHGLRLLDSITLYHRMETTSAQWAWQNGGGIFELHSYAVPKDISDDKTIRTMLLQEFEDFFPEIKGYTIRYEYLQVREDFTAFHTRLNKSRPETRTPVPNLYFAGDWVKMPCPAMLMEAAATSALFAVNEIFTAENLRQEKIYSVPLTGIFA